MYSAPHCFVGEGCTYLHSLFTWGMQLALFSRLCNEVLSRRALKRYDAESLALAAALLEQNPEVYTAWNFRREALQTALEVCFLLHHTSANKCSNAVAGSHEQPGCCLCG